MKSDKKEPRNLGFALVEYFEGRQDTATAIEAAREESANVEKNNPHRDRSTGRFTYGPDSGFGPDFPAEESDFDDPERIY